METERALSSAWDQHLGSEFAAKSADQALATMTAEPYVNVVPLMIGARGASSCTTSTRTISSPRFRRTWRCDGLADHRPGPGRRRARSRFTHSIRLDWLLPGIPPTGKRVELPFVVLVQFEGDKVAHEHLYWDQASVLVQVGLLDRTLPVRGGEIAAQVLNPTQPMNELIHRALNTTGDSPA